MCRNIKTLFNFEPPATAEEVRNASLQFVRKLSGFNSPSKINEAAFERAVHEIVHATTHLLAELPPRQQPPPTLPPLRRRAAAAGRPLPPA